MFRPVLAVGLTAGLAWLAPAAMTPATATEPFTRVSSFPIFQNLPEGTDPATETVAEIVTSAMDGNLLVYTDSELEAIGRVDIADPANPKPAGIVMVGGEPTSVAVLGKHAYVGVNTSESYEKPSGHVAVVELDSGRIATTCDVQGQPDSVAISPDGRYLAIAIENERDEDLNEGEIPQLPAGHLASFQVEGDGMLANCAAVTVTDLTGLAEIAPSDPEPEFVSINSLNQAVVTLQENNHLAVVDLARNKVINHFSAGSVDLENADFTKDGVINLSERKEGLRREPDAVAWLDNTRFVTANEGDYEGGSRGFSVFTVDGRIPYDSGTVTERMAVSLGHYPEKRSGKKGSEPEGVAVGSFNGERLVMVGLERANLVGLFREDIANGGMELIQALPSGGVGPEGITTIGERGLIVISNEKDSAEDGLRSTIAIYQQGGDGPLLPQIVSVDGPDGQPIGWGALSGLAAHPSDPAILYAVNDSFYSVAHIYTLDVSAEPARIVAAQAITRDGKPVENLDPEGIAAAPDGSFYVASEGHPDKDRANLILHVLPDGEVAREITLPEVLESAKKRFGLEGVALEGNRLYVVVQREWHDDPKGMTKILTMDLASSTWGVMHYPLDKPESAAGGWVGLSEITALGNGRFAILERDNQAGTDAAIKRVYQVDLSAVTPAAVGAEPPVLSKTLAMDLLPMLQAAKGWTADKVEGFTLAADGQLYAVTDNDGVDGSPGESLFLRLGPVNQLQASR
ncbi:alkaline phosphatase [Pelagibius litoralis]|uniref:Alkaline phosphatase n=1 Tax=Pelagibius litoralis TaxID=374515 RepID=A0A967EYU2_9PROT|nr:esterase-like activity of phytase family protein [Pelagibius litoralis]NIA69963.1 alkaline phosphatase [Pelagibius litoralis]